MSSAPELRRYVLSRNIEGSGHVLKKKKRKKSLYVERIERQLREQNARIQMLEDQLEESNLENVTLRNGFFPKESESESESESIPVSTRGSSLSSDNIFRVSL